MRSPSLRRLLPAFALLAALTSTGAAASIDPATSMALGRSALNLGARPLLTDGLLPAAFKPVDIALAAPPVTAQPAATGSSVLWEVLAAVLLGVAILWRGPRRPLRGRYSAAGRKAMTSMLNV